MGQKTPGWRPLLLLTALILPAAESLRVSGTFRPEEFFKFLAKFGFQKTDAHSRRESFGYIYGNATADVRIGADGEGEAGVTLAVLDRALFLQLYGTRNEPGSASAACRRMFSVAGPEAYDTKCAPKGQDYLRRVPCPEGGLCPDEDSPQNVLPKNQFTYVIQNLRQPR